MAIWSTKFLTPPTHTWHDVTSGIVDTYLNYMNIANLSTGTTSRIAIGVKSASDTPLTAPALPAISILGTTGSTTYTYVVTAVKSDGRETEASPACVITNGAGALNASNKHTITWESVQGADRYRLYCRVGNEQNAIIKTTETNTLTYINNGNMSEGEKWPWINLTDTTALISWNDLAPGCGVELTTRPIPVPIGDKIRLYTTGAITAYAAGAV